MSKKKHEERVTVTPEQYVNLLFMYLDSDVPCPGVSLLDDERSFSKSESRRLDDDEYESLKGRITDWNEGYGVYRNRSRTGDQSEDC